MSRSPQPNVPAYRFVENLGYCLSVDELAQYLQLSRDTIYHWRLAGVGPKATKLGLYLARWTACSARTAGRGSPADSSGREARGPMHAGSGGEPGAAREPSA